MTLFVSLFVKPFVTPLFASLIKRVATAPHAMYNVLPTCVNQNHVLRVKPFVRLLPRNRAEKSCAKPRLARGGVELLPTVQNLCVNCNANNLLVSLLRELRQRFLWG